MCRVVQVESEHHAALEGVVAECEAGESDELKDEPSSERTRERVLNQPWVWLAFAVLRLIQ